MGRLDDDGSRDRDCVPHGPAEVKLPEPDTPESESLAWTVLMIAMAFIMAVLVFTIVGPPW